MLEAETVVIQTNKGYNYGQNIYKVQITQELFELCSKYTEWETILQKLDSIFSKKGIFNMPTADKHLSSRSYFDREKKEMIVLFSPEYDMQATDLRRDNLWVVVGDSNNVLESDVVSSEKKVTYQFGKKPNVFFK